MLRVFVLVLEIKHFFWEKQTKFLKTLWKNQFSNLYFYVKIPDFQNLGSFIYFVKTANISKTLLLLFFLDLKFHGQQKNTKKSLFASPSGQYIFLPHPGLLGHRAMSYFGSFGHASIWHTRALSGHSVVVCKQQSLDHIANYE